MLFYYLIGTSLTVLLLIVATMLENSPTGHSVYGIHSSPGSNGIGDDMLDDEAGKVRDVYSDRVLCVIIGNEILERRGGPVVGVICGNRVHRACLDGEVVALMSGRYLRSAESHELLATITDTDIHEGIGGALLATFDGGWFVGVGGLHF